jgi:hypothetical protein
LQADTPDAGKKQWLLEEEALIRRVMNHLMETYQLGSTAAPAQAA